MAEKIALKTVGSEEWETPPELFEKLDQEFHFTLDPCATRENAKCENYFTKRLDGLRQDWFGRIFVNPPFRHVAKWVKKAYIEVDELRAELVVLLVAARTDTAWFHEYCLPYAEIRFIKGRLKYVGAKNSSPFPAMLIIFRRHWIRPSYYPESYEVPRNE